MIRHTKAEFSPTNPEIGRALEKRANGRKRPYEKMGGHSDI